MFFNILDSAGYDKCHFMLANCWLSARCFAKAIFGNQTLGKDMEIGLTGKRVKYSGESGQKPACCSSNKIPFHCFKVLPYL